jgi:hypothetical protein
VVFSVDAWFVVRELWRLFRTWSLLVPLLVAVALGMMITENLYAPEKGLLEFAAIVMLSVATALAFARFLASRHPFFLWGSGLLSVLLCREIHFMGTSTGVYIGMVVMLVVANRYYANLREYLATSFVTNALAMGSFAYLVAVTIDARWWKARAAWPGIPGEEVFHVPLEELMELVGHVLILAALLLARPVRPPTFDVLRHRPEAISRVAP